MATKWSEPAKDAVDTMVLGSADLESLCGVELVDHRPLDASMRRTESTVVENGQLFRISKGAPAAILELLSDSQKSRLQPQVEKQVEALGVKGVHAIAIAKTNPQDADLWELLGLLSFLDPVRSDSKDTISRAKEFGVRIKLLTGDDRLITQEVATHIGLGRNIVSADSLPLLSAQQNIPKVKAPPSICKRLLHCPTFGSASDTLVIPAGSATKTWEDDHAGRRICMRPPRAQVPYCGSPATMWAHHRHDR